LGRAMPAKFKDRLHHNVPAWVAAGATFHVRVRCAQAQLARAPLNEPSLATPLLESVRFYHSRSRWCCFLFMLMPDHFHALVAFPRQEAMSAVLHDWKSWHARTQSIEWQDGYFDHRIRDNQEFELKADYIRRNPVVKGLCVRAEDWPWVCEPFSAEVGGHVPVPALNAPSRESGNAGTGTCPPTFEP
jgi:hypothetical protein